MVLRPPAKIAVDATRHITKPAPSCANTHHARANALTVFTGVSARGNGPPDCAGSSQGVGIKAWHSVQIANAVIEDGTRLRRCCY